MLYINKAGLPWCLHSMLVIWRQAHYISSLLYQLWLKSAPLSSRPEDRGAAWSGEIWLRMKSKFSQNPDFSTPLRCARNDTNKRIDYAQLVLLAFSLPGLLISRGLTGFGRSHSNGHRDGYFFGTANNPAQLFFRYPDGPSDKFGDTVGPKAWIIICRIFLGQPNRLMYFAAFI